LAINGRNYGNARRRNYSNIENIDTFVITTWGAMSYIPHITRRATILFTIPENNCAKN